MSVLLPHQPIRAILALKSLVGAARNDLAKKAPAISTTHGPSTPVQTQVCSKSPLTSREFKESARILICDLCDLAARRLVTSTRAPYSRAKEFDVVSTSYCQHCYKSYLAQKWKSEKERISRLASQHAKVDEVLSKLRQTEVDPQVKVTLDYAVALLRQRIARHRNTYIAFRSRRWYRNQIVRHLSEELKITKGKCSQQRAEAMNFKAWLFQDSSF